MIAHSIRELLAGVVGIPLICLYISFFVSVLSVIPAAIGHVAGRLNRRQQIRRTGTTTAVYDAASPTRPTFLIYFYGYFASVATGTILATFFLMVGVFLSEIGEYSTELSDATTNVTNLMGYIMLPVIFAVTFFVVSTISFRLASTRISKRRQQRAATQLAG